MKVMFEEMENQGKEKSLQESESCALCEGTNTIMYTSKNRKFPFFLVTDKTFDVHGVYIGCNLTVHAIIELEMFA